MKLSIEAQQKIMNIMSIKYSICSLEDYRIVNIEIFTEDDKSMVDLNFDTSLITKDNIEFIKLILNNIENNMDTWEKLYDTKKIKNYSINFEKRCFGVVSNNEENLSINDNDKILERYITDNENEIILEETLSLNYLREGMKEYINGILLEIVAVVESEL